METDIGTAEMARFGRGTWVMTPSLDACLDWTAPAHSTMSDQSTDIVKHKATRREQRGRGGNPFEIGADGNDGQIWIEDGERGKMSRRTAYLRRRRGKI